jgi:hypothetical protein
MEAPLTPLDFARRTRRLHGSREAVVLGEVAQYERIFRLCYLRGPRASSSPWPNRSADASLPRGAGPSPPAGAH